MKNALDTVKRSLNPKERKHPTSSSDEEDIGHPQGAVSCTATNSYVVDE